MSIQAPTSYLARQQWAKCRSERTRTCFGDAKQSDRSHLFSRKIEAFAFICRRKRDLAHS